MWFEVFVPSVFLLIIPLVVFHFFCVQSTDQKKVTAQRPLLLRYVDGFGLLWKNLFGTSFLDLSAQSIIQTAEKRTGLSDFGTDDWRKPLDLLVKSYLQSPQLSFSGAIAIKNAYIRYLSERLHLVKTLKERKGITDIPIKRPLFIIGLPRTGTTKLYNLMSMDPLKRVLRVFELLDSRYWNKEEALFGIRNDLRYINYIQPELKKIHFISETSPEECLLIFAKCFLDVLVVSGMNSPEYYNYWLSEDMSPFYQFHKRFLQYTYVKNFDNCKLNPEEGASWILKAPFHLFFLRELLETYPDACVVTIHRKIEDVIGSICSLNACHRLSFENEIDFEEVGDVTSRFWAKAMDRALEYRTSLPEEVQRRIFFDLSYDDLMRDSVGSIQKMYNHFGFEYSDDFGRGIEQWEKENPQGKHGRHVYELDKFGITKEHIATRFEKYLQFCESFSINI